MVVRDIGAGPAGAGLPHPTAARTPDGGYSAVIRPPLTTRVWPVTYRDAGEHRNAAHGPMSVTVSPIHPIGISAVIRRSIDGSSRIALSSAGVTASGASPFTRIRSGPHSR